MKSVLGRILTYIQAGSDAHLVTTYMGAFVHLYLVLQLVLHYHCVQSCDKRIA